jgi:HD-like signal output (HDOD) protein
VLGLIANTDPVFIARVLAAANASVNGRSIATDAFEAVKRIGTAAAYDWLLAVAATAVWTLPEEAVRYRNGLTLRSVRITAGLRRRARVRALDEKVAGLLGIFESMGLYALLATDNPQVTRVFEEVLGPGSVVGPSGEGRLCGYHFMSCRVCRDWGVPSEVTEALHPLTPNSYSYLLEEVLYEEDLSNAPVVPS